MRSIHLGLRKKVSGKIVAGLVVIAPFTLLTLYPRYFSGTNQVLPQQVQTNEVQVKSPKWIAAYYGGWELGTGENGRLPVSKVDFSAMTEVIHFAIVPKADGSLDTVSNTITSAGTLALTKAAHQAGTLALISVGGWNTEGGFQGATSADHLLSFVRNIAAFVGERRYDGVDIDWEPLGPQDYGQFTNLMLTLRGALGNSYLLTTTAAQGYAAAMAAVQQYVDQINIMTYDLSFPSPGWITWYNGAVHQNGITFPSTGGPVPSCDLIVSAFIAAGVPRGKIGIGVEFGGSVWKGGATDDGNGVTGPRQAWTTPPSFIPDVPYAAIKKDYYTPTRYHWDPGAEASYLSIDSAGSAGDCFISYEDSSDVIAKLSYIRKESLGGLILYELGMGYVPDQGIPLLEIARAGIPTGVHQRSIPSQRRGTD